MRSVYAYPSLIATAKGYTLNFRACSGAKVADVTSTQLSALGTSTAYVSITVGGNDAGFAGVLTDVRPAGLAEQLQRCRRRAPRPTSATPCPAALDTLYAAIRSRAPQAKVTVVGYPRIFNGVDCNLPDLVLARRR